ncbi:MAG: hypothetical protein MUO64_07435 [Anaerolineales bacterium]|nr:hypothetical protein [Anaerolineales bacterium]
MKRLHNLPVTLILMPVFVAGESIKNRLRGRSWSLKNASLFLLIATLLIVIIFTTSAQAAATTTTNDQKKFSKNSLDAAPVNGDSSNLLPYRLDYEGYQNLASDDSTAFAATQRTCLEVF